MAIYWRIGGKDSRNPFERYVWVGKYGFIGRRRRNGRDQTGQHSYLGGRKLPVVDAQIVNVAVPTPFRSAGGVVVFLSNPDVVAARGNVEGRIVDSPGVRVGVVEPVQIEHDMVQRNCAVFRHSHRNMMPFVIMDFGSHPDVPVAVANS